MNTSARRPGPITIALLALLPFAVGGACATGVVVGTGGAGGGASTGGGGEDGGEPDGPPGPCTMAADCVGFNDACNVGTCVNGTCVKGPANEFGGCDDGQFCTESDVCMSGVCIGGNPRYCAPPDACHLGACDEAADTCTAMAGNDGAQCDDMDVCTLAGTCSSGQCLPGLPVDCSVLSGQCAQGTCMPGQGCVAMPINEGQLCDDGNPAAGCSQGVCQTGMCVSTPKNDGQPCNDSLYCTINDHCMAAQCTGDPNPCAQPNNNCQIGVCNENLKSCTITVAPNGVACDDNSLCTTGETCLNGMCVNGQPANNGTACDDKNGCTTGTSCVNGVCGNPQSQINMCIAGDSCCPANCNFVQDADCLYWKSGIQENVPNSALVGWTQCWLGTYGSGPNDSPNITTLLNQCSKAKLLMACRPTGAPSWKLVAMGPRLDVLFDCGQQQNCTKQSNNVGWYFSSTYSWGFAPAGAAVSRNSCDFIGLPEPNDAHLRLCWHTGGGNMTTGFRCGDNSNDPAFWLNNNTNWERGLFHAD